MLDSNSKQDLLYRSICQKGMELLSNLKHRSQIEVIQKLSYLGRPFSEATFSNILNNKRVGTRTLESVSEGMQEIIKKELGMEWQEGQFILIKDENLKIEIIPVDEHRTSNSGLLVHENGRMPITQKVAFFRSAQKEVIELGVTLNKFTSNLYSGGLEESRLPIEKLLEKGVDYKCYIMNPDGNKGKLYFDDRASTNSIELHYAQKIKDNIEKLKTIQSEFSVKNFKGNFEVYTYDHVPYNYFMIVDGGTPICKMLASHYLFGLRRAESPMLQFSRQDQPALYRKYWQSFSALVKNAKRIIPSIPTN